MSARGGFVESCSSTTIRPRPTIVLPDRGPFLFPEPYGTTGIRLTNEDDGPILPTGYSYWCAINAHAGQDHLLVFLGTDRNHGGAGPSLWRVDKATDAVTALGPIFPPDHPWSWATGEGWYWSATEPSILYACSQTALGRVDVTSKRVEPVMDIGSAPISTVRTDEILWQFHSSHDGRVHSATVKGGESLDWKPLGIVTYREDSPQPWRWFPRRGALDEGQVDKGGEWLLIKENLDGQDGEDNRIIRLADGAERVLMDRDGAAGHSDNGFGYMVAADNWNDKPNALRLWMLDAGLEPQGRVVYYSPTWAVELNHVSHCNARPGSPDGQWALGSGATRAVGPRANEIVAFPLDGSLRVLVIAPTLVDLDAPGGGDDYAKFPKCNVDVTGEYALWTSNHGSDRLDAFLVRIPQQLTQPPTTPDLPTAPRPTWRIEGSGPIPIVTQL